VSYVDVSSQLWDALLHKLKINICTQVLEDIGSEGIDLELVSKPILASHTLMTSYDDSTVKNGHVSPANGIIRETKTIQKTEVLHVDTSNEPIA
jgi:hypothetical protein